MAQTNWLERLSQLPDFESYGAASLEDIQAVENKLCLTLPDAYRHFLARYGACDWEGNALYGVYHGDMAGLKEYYDVAIRTQEAWNDRYPKVFLPVPRDSLVLTEYGGGGFYMLACNNHPKPGSVYLILTETAHRIDDQWDSLEEFVNKEIFG